MHFKYKILLFTLPLFFWAGSVLASSDYLSTKYGDDLPPLAQEMLKGNDNASTTEQENISTMTSSDAFVSEVSVPKKEEENDTPPDPRNPFDREDENKMGVRTEFDNIDDQVRQTISLKSGMDVTSFNMNLINSSGYDQEIYQNENGDTKVYTGENEIITYTQTTDSTINDPSIKLKESIYALKPNQEKGSKYVWAITSNDPNSSLKLEIQPDGSVNIYRIMLVSGIDPTNTNEQQRIMDVVSQALDNASLDNKRLIAVIEPLTYITNDNNKKTVPYRIEGNNLIINIEEKDSAYPLTIDPSLKWSQWLSSLSTSSTDDYLKAVAVNGNEIYIGGYSSVASMSNITYTNGENNGGTDGFVIELTDNEGSAPTMNWLQWAGGTGNDVITSVTVNGDEVYAGGYAANNTSWESPAYTSGAYTASTEGFVIEIQDTAGAPVLNWLQWLGGDGTDYVYGVAVTGDEIYAAGTTDTAATNWDTATYTGGTYSGNNEGFVVEIADTAAAPTLNWLQWYGTSLNEIINSVAVNGDEIYAGGYLYYITGIETTTYTGGTFTDTGGWEEGFVIEMADNDSAAPTLNWVQWFGGNGKDFVYAVAVSGNEIYAAGTGNDATNFDSATYSNGTVSGYEGFVGEIADNEGAAPTLTWLQWIGGTGNDYVFSLAINGEEVFAGGLATNFTTWESFSYTIGAYTSGNEDFVVKLTDNAGSAPTRNWLQWLGGTGSDSLYGLANNGDEIYVAGYTDSSSNWEVASSTGGSYSSLNDGYITEIYDNNSVAPNHNWFQWIGAGYSQVNDYVNALAVNGDEIYAGGYTEASTQFTTANYTGGSNSGMKEGFVAEILNSGTAPVVNWLQWLGGTNDDIVWALAVDGDEIYAAGTTDNTNAGWETATYTGGSYTAFQEGFVVEMADNPSSAPTLNWLQWYGGTQNDYILAIAINGDEIYAGGYVQNNTSIESTTYTGGTYTDSTWEGFVLEMTDNASAAPTLNWVQWLGGILDDKVYALAVNGNEIYAAGTSNSTIGWDSATYSNGALSGNEGFVVEIADNEGGAPVLTWLQWLGGTGFDYVYALAVNGDSIYAGGSAGNATTWEAFNATLGSYSGSDEGFVAKLVDNPSAAPTLTWLQWLGGTGNDYVYQLAVNNDSEIYAVGVSAVNNNWETAANTYGSFNGANEGFVVELSDKPMINWMQWLGGTGYDTGYALAVNNNYIYTGLWAGNGTNWENPLYTSGSFSGLCDIIIYRIKDDPAVSYAKFPTAVKEAGLIGYWSLNGADMDWGSTTAEVLDRSGNNKNCDANFDKTRVAVGYIGQAMQLNGSGDFADCGTNSITGSSPFTLVAWINTNTLSKYSGAVSIGDAGSGQSAYIGTVTTVSTGVANSIGGGFYGHNIGSGVKTMNDWVQVALKYKPSGSGDDEFLYVNGQLKVSDDYTPNLLSTYTRIGRIASDTSYDFSGLVDDVRIYNRALSDSEIAELYRQTSSRVRTNTVGKIISGGLAGYWSFNGPDVATTSAIDRSGNNITGWFYNGVKIIPGIIGQAIELNQNYINIIDSPALNVSSGQGYTVAAWVKTSDQYGHIVSLRNFYSGWQVFNLSVGYDGVEDKAGYFLPLMRYDSKTGLARLQSPQIINDNQWHFVSVILDQANNTFTGYVDNTSFSVAQDVDGVITLSRDLAIGAEMYWGELGGGGYTNDEIYLNGLIDEVRIYNRALSATEISELYKQAYRRSYYKEQ